MDFKDIHIGSMVKRRVAESGIEISRICDFLKMEEIEVESMYHAKSLDSEILLRWSKLLDMIFLEFIRSI